MIVSPNPPSLMLRNLPNHSVINAKRDINRLSGWTVATVMAARVVSLGKRSELATVITGATVAGELLI